MKEFFNNLKFVWKYAKDCKKEMLLFVFLNLIYIIFSVIIPVLSAYIIVSLTNSEFRQVMFIAVVILISYLVQFVVDYFIRYFNHITYRETLKEIGSDLAREVLKLSNKSIDENSSGVFIQRLTGDTTKIADIFQELTFKISDIIANVGMLIAIFLLSKVLFVYIFISLVIIYFLENIRVKTYNNHDKSYREKNEKLFGFIGELVRGVRDIKMLNAENSFMRKLDKEINDVNDKRYMMSRVNRMYFLIIDSILTLFETGLIFISVIFIIKGDLSVANSLVIHNYSNRLPYLVDCVGSIMEKIKEFNLSCKRILDIFDSNDFKKEKFGNKHLDLVNGDFEFKNVYFKYSDGKEVLKDLSFKVNANETVAFVGKSGAGKSTIFSLLCKMYDIDSGVITIDGVNISELDKDSIRGNITIISQNPYIFNLSIRDNLKLVKDDLTDDEMIEACKLACFHDFVISLPNGYDTVVGEGGISLSGGERQRLAIARAFVQKTEIILFDEATSALDNETQAKIKMAIDNMKRDYTILIIAHRLSTIINSDRILYLNDGKIEASGKHSTLIKKCKGYRELYEADLLKDDE